MSRQTARAADCYSPFQRWISRLLIVTVTGMALQPLTAAAQAANVNRSTQKQVHHLEDVEDAVKQAVPEVWHKGGKRVASDDDRAQAAQNVLEAADAIDQEADGELADFQAIESDLRDKKVAPEILARHNQAVQDFQSRRAEFKRLTQAVDTAVGGRQGFLAKFLGKKPHADNPAALSTAMTDLAGFLAKHPNKRRHTASDPDKLPWGSAKPATREPYTSPTQFQLSGLFPTVKLAAVGSLQGITLPVSAGPTPTSADLAETEDVQLTAAIKALAAALGNNPVKIHNWVRNTIEFIPSYGSIQGADLTLQSRRGNAFDTASLEIALLRAANIPARYVYGTVEVPTEPVMNWVGGVTTPGAAQSLMARGGIPTVGLVSGGKVAAFRFEHVWVEAWVNYVPGRGTKNLAGDTWVPLDASFKQYSYKSGMDLKNQVPLDGQGLLDQAKQGATVNETEGWVQNLNQANLNAALTDYQAKIKAYIDQTNAAATVGDVLGTKTIKAANPPALMGTLPYKTIATGSKFAQMPANLQWKFRTTLYDAGIDYLGDPMGNTLVSLSQSTPTLAGKKITLSFTPATQADIDLLNSYLPKPHADGTPIQASELPTSLPAYLLKLKAELRVDGQLVSQSTVAAGMGQTLTQATAYFNPGSQTWEESEANAPIAGDYHAIGLDLQGTSQAQLAALKARLEATKAKLEAFQANPNDTTPIQNMTKEDLTGDLLYSGILGYFASVDGSDQLVARMRGDIVNYRLPSFGAFFAGAQPRYWFGIVRSVSFPGVTMDVDRVMYQTEAKDEDKTKRYAYFKQVGSAGSAYEHEVPEKLFIDPAKCNRPDATNPDPAKPACAQGISAVKALAIAASQGQKIYTLNTKNQSYHAGIVASLGTDADTKAEISNALAAGREVTVHQADITVSGWTGIGYTILDSESGAGAYKISGGANGAWLAGFAAGAMLGLFLAGMATAAMTGPMVIAALGIILVYIVAMLIPFIALLAALYHDNASNDEWKACFWGGFGVGLSMAARTMPGGILAELALWLGIALGIGVPSNAGTQCFN
jgi:transglutaminase-like putative cysteine protease